MEASDTGEVQVQTACWFAFRFKMSSTPLAFQLWLVTEFKNQDMYTIFPWQKKK